MTLSAIDWIIIVSYFMITLAVGLFFAGRAGKSLTEFFISGRSLPWWIAGTSMVATTFAADTPLAVTGIVIKDGLAGNWIWWAFAFGGMITVFVYSRLWRRAEVVTDVELVELRYAGWPSALLRGFRAVYVALLVNSIIIGWVCGAMITFLNETLFPEARDSIAGQWGILVGCLAIVAVYSTLSGLWGVAITDMLQFVLAMIGCIILAIVAVNHIGGVDALQEQAVAKFGGDEALRFIPSFTGDNAWMPFYAFLIVCLVQWWATWYPGAEPGGGGYVVQRMAACRDERHSLLATLWYQIAHYCLRPWPWIMVAFVALVMYPELREKHLSGANVNPDVGYPWIIRDLAPVGLRGLMIATFFAAFMSTISTQMNWGASYLVRDIYQRFIRQDAEPRHYARVARIASLVVLSVGAVVAWFMKDYSIETIWNTLLALGAGTGAVFMLRWFWWRINAWTEISAMLASLVLFLLIGVKEKAIVTQIWFVDRPQDRILIIALGSIVIWVIVTMLTRPEPTKTLEAFYRKIRPGGPGWGPIARKAPDVQVDKNLALSIVTAIVAAAMVYLVLPGTGFAIFGNYPAAIGCFVGAAVCGGVMLFLMNRMGTAQLTR